MKDIILKITGKTVSSIPKQEDYSGDTIEFVTVGKLAERGGLSLISYEESPISGMQGCKTSIAITPGKITLRRKGGEIKDETVMEFEEGIRHSALYETPYGPIGMEILASRVSGLEDLGENKSRLSIEYDVSLKGLLEERKTLDIEVVNKN